MLSGANLHVTSMLVAVELAQPCWTGLHLCSLIVAAEAASLPTLRCSCLPGIQGAQ